MKQYHIASVVLLVVLIAFLTATFWEYTQDDVYITYVYSRNISEGNGFVFNEGEHVQGTTTPLYALLMAGVYLFTDDLLHAGNFLSAVFLGIAILMGMRVLNDTLSRYGQWAFAFVVASSPLVYISFGMETLFYCAVLFGAFLFWTNGKFSYAMFMAGVLTWIRSDGIVLAGGIGLLVLFQNIIQNNKFNWKVIPWHLGILYILVIAPWYIFATVYFGTPLPQTFSAKQGMFSGWEFIVGGEGGLHWWDSLYFKYNPLSVLAFPSVAIGTWTMLQQAKWRILPIWIILYTLGYTILNVTTYWYLTPLFMALVVLAVVGAEWSVKCVMNYGVKRKYAITSSMMLVIIFTILSTAKAYDMKHRPERVDLYIVAGQWIEANTPDDSLLLVRDLGITGYYAKRRTVDTPGLITPQLQFIGEDPYAIASLEPDYILGVQYWNMKPLYEQQWFNDLYRPLIIFDDPHEPFAPMIVFERRDMEVLNEESDPATVVQGEPFGISYSVEVNEGMPIPKIAQATIYDIDGNVVLEPESAFLGHNYPENVAEQTQILHDTLVVQNGLPTGTYTWEILGGLYAGQFEVISIMEADGYISIYEDTWADFVKLQGIYVPRELKAWAGGEVEMGLVWEAITPTSEDYSVFVQVKNAKGEIVAQADGYPRNDTIYTRFWQEGEIVHDIRRIQLPDNLPSGSYQVVVGWYDWRTDERFLTESGIDEVQLPTAIHVVAK